MSRKPLNLSSPDAARKAEINAARAANLAKARAARKPRELHTGDMPIEQKADIVDHKNYDGDIILADPVDNKDWLVELAFNEEPVTIRLEPSSDKNAATVFPVWVEGKGAEILMNGKWVSITYLPVGQVVTTKRKYLEVIVRAKRDNINTVHEEATVERPRNAVSRVTSSANTVSIIEDRNPKGAAWLTELHRRAA